MKVLTAVQLWSWTAQLTPATVWPTLKHLIWLFNCSQVLCSGLGPLFLINGNHCTVRCQHPSPGPLSEALTVKIGQLLLFLSFYWLWINGFHFIRSAKYQNMCAEFHALYHHLGSAFNCPTDQLLASLADCSSGMSKVRKSDSRFSIWLSNQELYTIETWVTAWLTLHQVTTSVPVQKDCSTSE